MLRLYISKEELSDLEIDGELIYTTIFKSLFRPIYLNFITYNKNVVGVVNFAFQDFDFPNKVINLQQLDTNFFIAELFHGPTVR